MSTGHFDCFSGVSGNMILGALLDAGLELDDRRGALAHLGVSGYTVQAKIVKRRGIRGTHDNVNTEHQGPERHSQDIAASITGSDLPERVQRQSLTIFRRVDEAGARVHGVPVDHVHFHEVGALDAIVDVH